MDPDWICIQQQAGSGSGLSQIPRSGLGENGSERLPTILTFTVRYRTWLTAMDTVRIPTSGCSLYRTADILYGIRLMLPDPAYLWIRAIVRVR